MRINIPIDECFRADEIIRIGRALQYQTLRDHHRKAILEDLDRTLPDYDRPIKKSERKYKGVSILKLLKYLLP